MESPGPDVEFVHVSAERRAGGKCYAPDRTGRYSPGDLTGSRPTVNGIVIKRSVALQVSIDFEDGQLFPTGNRSGHLPWGACVAACSTPLASRIQDRHSKHD